MAKTHVVLIKDMTFQPDPLSVEAGDEVIWDNQDVGTPHTATFSFGSTGRIQGGKKSKPLKIPSAGTHSYYCEIHPEMTGTVRAT